MSSHPRRALCALVSSLLAACTSDAPSGIEHITAHVSPLQTLSIEGLAPAQTHSGFVRFEAEHFAYEVPVTTTKPLTVTAPIFVGEDGAPSGGLVHVYWLPTASPTTVNIINAQMPAPARRSDAVDLHLDLLVGELPRFAYAAQPGVLLRAFAAGTLAALSGTYEALFSSGIDASLASDYQSQRAVSQTALTEALAAIDRVRMVAAGERLAPVIVPGGSISPSLSLDSLRLADRLVGAFLLAERMGMWTARAKPTGPRDVNSDVGVAQSPLGVDLEGEASAWVPNTADELAGTVLDRAGHLAGFVSHATGAGAVAGALDVASSSSASAEALSGAAAFSALTYAPAATASVIRAAGTMLRGSDSLTRAAAETFAARAQSVIAHNLAPAFDALRVQVEPWADTTSDLVNALGAVATALSGWTDLAADRTSTWLVTCVSEPEACSQGDAGLQPEAADGGSSVGQCNQAQLAGGDLPLTRSFEVGSSCADLDLDYDTYSVEDAITVRYEGAVVAASGCVGAHGTLAIHFCGSSSEVEVSVEPNCAGSSSTSWTFTLSCPTAQ